MLQHPETTVTGYAPPRLSTTYICTVNKGRKGLKPTYDDRIIAIAYKPEGGPVTVLKEWELRVLEYLWSIYPSGASSREVWSHLQQTMSEPISRASVINFLLLRMS